MINEPKEQKPFSRTPSSIDAVHTAKYEDMVESILAGQASKQANNPLGEILRRKKTSQELELEKAAAQTILEEFRADIRTQLDGIDFSGNLTKYLDGLSVVYDEIEERYVIDAEDPEMQNAIFNFNSYDDYPVWLSFPSILRCETVWLPDSSLYEIKELPDNCTTLQVRKNRLRTLPSLPEWLEYLECSENIVESLPDALPPDIATLSCSQNRITTLPELPKYLRILHCEANPLKNLPKLPEGLASLTFGSDELEQLPEVPDSLLQYRIEYASLFTAIPSLPPQLELFSCDNTPIKEVPPLPDSLTDLYLWHTGISELPKKLPDGLITITVSGHNRLEYLPELPEGLTELKCSENMLKALPRLPSTLTELCCDENAIEELPELPDGLQKISCIECLIVDLPDIPASVTDADFRGNPLSEAAQAICEQRGFSYD